MEFLGKLGIDTGLLIAQIINFGLLLWFLAKFVYGPVMKRIEKDEYDLNRAKEQTEVLEKEKNEFELKKTEEIKNAKKQAKDILEEAEGIAEEIKKRAREESDKEKEAVIKQIHSRLKEIENGQKIDKQ